MGVLYWYQHSPWCAVILWRAIFFGGVEAQVLCRLLMGAASLMEYPQFQQLQYMRIIPSYITAVRLRLLDEKAIPIELNGWVYCTLHIRKKDSLL